jgi:rhodanese-related sulfurtransferase
MSFGSLAPSAGGGQAGAVREQPPSPVTAVPAAEPATAHAHFAGRLAVETDADDVAAALAADRRDFVLLDACSPAAYDAAHLSGAISLPHALIGEDTLADLPAGLLLVVCWGPGCNAAAKAAAKLSGLGRQVKEMLGGFEYWVRKGHPLEGDTAHAERYAADRNGLVRLPPEAGCGC